MYEQAQERLWIETELRQAIDSGQLMPFYQPIVSLITGRIIGFEVLIRWNHPQRGFIKPEMFIPIAEENGLIGIIGAQMLTKSCQQAYLWTQAFYLHTPFTINVNISGKEFLSPDLFERVANALTTSGLEPSRLKLEITETVAMDYAEMTVNTLNQLRTLGVQIALDDFGMGYSSLRYLPRFPIQTIKIDRSFVSTMGEKMESETIVRTIVTMAHTMGLDVVAEGIETDIHLSYLKGMNCDYGQGFLFSNAVNAEGVWQLLQQPTLQ
jgi:EAL domain-containing protein (putative c-di-GMP-specific phosphodiesterase class I)